MSQGIAAADLSERQIQTADSVVAGNAADTVIIPAIAGQVFRLLGIFGTVYAAAAVGRLTFEIQETQNGFPLDRVGIASSGVASSPFAHSLRSGILETPVGSGLKVHAPGNASVTLEITAVGFYHAQF